MGKQLSRFCSRRGVLEGSAASRTLSARTTASAVREMALIAPALARRPVVLPLLLPLLLLLLAGVRPGGAAEAGAFKPGQEWLDTEGQPINAHGGGILYGERARERET